MRTKLTVLLLLALCTPVFAGNDDAAAAAFAEAEAKYQQRDYEAALEKYKKFAEQYPNDWRADQARFTAGFILQKKLSRPAQASQAFAAVVEKHTSAPLAKNAEFHLAQSYEQSGETTKAMDTYKDFLKKADRHPRAVVAQRKLDGLDRKAKGQTPPEISDEEWARRIVKRWRRMEREFRQENPERPNQPEKFERPIIGAEKRPRLKQKQGDAAPKADGK